MFGIPSCTSAKCFTVTLETHKHCCMPTETYRQTCRHRHAETCTLTHTQHTTTQQNTQHNRTHTEHRTQQNTQYNRTHAHTQHNTTERAHARTLTHALTHSLTHSADREKYSYKKRGPEIVFEQTSLEGSCQRGSRSLRLRAVECLRRTIQNRIRVK